MSPELSLPWVQKTEYGTDNITRGSKLWEDIEFDPGIVALDQQWTRAKGLPDSQPFPWDTSKGLYVLNGYHSMHCLVSQTQANSRSIASLTVIAEEHSLLDLRMEFRQAPDLPISAHYALS